MEHAPTSSTTSIAPAYPDGRGKTVRKTSRNAIWVTFAIRKTTALETYVTRKLAPSSASVTTHMAEMGEFYQYELSSWRNGVNLRMSDLVSGKLILISGTHFVPRCALSNACNSTVCNEGICEPNYEQPNSNNNPTSGISCNCSSTTFAGEFCQTPVWQPVRHDTDKQWDRHWQTVRQTLTNSETDTDKQ